MSASEDNICYGCCPEEWGVYHACQNCEHAPGEAGRCSERVEAAKIKISKIWKMVALALEKDRKKQAIKDRKLAIKERKQRSIRKKENALKVVKK